MRNIIVCWVNDISSFNDNVPLHFMGERNVRLGFKNNFDILFLEGFELLPKNYKSYLKNLGFCLHDVNHLYSYFNKKFNALNRFKDFEKKCFLRWLVIQQYFGVEKIIHYDGDVLFNENPYVLQRELQGKTFVLQGCPALTCISDPVWFLQYQEHLAYFVNDIDCYSNDAWTKREGWEKSEQEKWAGSRYRYIISSDQDLISHLIHTDQIWHMQSSFNHYLYKFILRKKYFKFLFFQTLKNSVEEKDFEHYLSLVINKFSRHKRASRLKIYKYFFLENDLREVLMDKIWWKKGVFV